MRYCYTLFLILSFQFAPAQQLPSHSIFRIDTTFKIQAYESGTGDTLLCRHLCKSPTGDLLMMFANEHQSKYYFVKADKFFQTQWAQLFEDTEATQYFFCSFTVTPSGKKLITGVSDNFDSSGNYLSKSLFIACLNSSDSLEWCKQFEGGYYMWPLQLLLLNGNKVLFTFLDYNQQQVIRMLCLNENGELQWAKRSAWGCPSLNVCTDFSGNNIFLAASTGHVVKLNSNGDVIWSKLFSNGSHYYFNNVTPVNDSKIAVLGSLDLMKLDTNGNFKWYSHVKNGEKGSTSYYPVSICSLGDSGFIEIISIVSDGGMFTYYSNGLFTFDHNGNLIGKKMASEILNDVVSIGNKGVCAGTNLLSGLDANANFSCSSIGDMTYWSSFLETINPVDQAMLSNDYPSLETFHLPDLISVTITFDTICFSTHSVYPQLNSAITGQNIDTSSSNSDSIVANLEAPYGFSIYPNPVQDILYFKRNYLFEGTSSLELYDMIGNRVGEWLVPEANAVTKIDLQNLPSAIYLLYVNYDHAVHKFKIMKY
jgi:hypothetical protein